MAILITTEDIKNADDYIGNYAKEELARNIAVLCCEPVEVKSDELVLPKRYRENRRLRQQYLMGVFAKFYLKRDFKLQKASVNENGENKEINLYCCMDEDQYDEYAGSHIINQMERLKKSKEDGVANKVFDILYDFRCFETTLNGCIRDELEARNDSFDRLSIMLGTLVTPEMLKEIANANKEKTEKILSDINDYKLKKE